MLVIKPQGTEVSLLGFGQRHEVRVGAAIDERPRKGEPPLPTLRLRQPDDIYFYRDGLRLKLKKKLHLKYLLKVDQLT